MVCHCSVVISSLSLDSYALPICLDILPFNQLTDKVRRNYIALVDRPREITRLLFIYVSFINLGKLLLLRANHDFTYRIKWFII